MRGKSSLSTVFVCFVTALLILSCGLAISDALGPAMAAQPGSPGSGGSGSSASAPDATFSFNLIGPNTTKDDGTGNTITLTGGGSFDTPGGPVVASGTFAIFNAAGEKVSKGMWNATAFGSFNSFGGPNPGFQGGVLEIIATFTPTGGTPVPGTIMVVTCLVNKPAGFTGKEGVILAPAEEGFESFTDIIRGATLFHKNG